MLRPGRVIVVEDKFVCPVPSEAKHTEMLEFGVEKGLCIAGPCKENRAAAAQKTGWVSGKKLL